MPKRVNPPVLLEGCRVEQFAVRDRAFRFRGHGLLFRDNKEVGPVRRLALGRARDGAVMLFHCDTRWNVVGAMSYAGLRLAKQRAERFYPGISTAWVRTGYTQSQATRLLRRTGANQKCSICAKPWFKVEQMVTIEKRRIVLCDRCIRDLFGMIAKNGNEPAAEPSPNWRRTRCS